MHSLSSCILALILLATISVRSAPLPKPSIINLRLCPEDHSESRQRQDEAHLENNNDDSDADESHESMCEQAMEMIVQHHNIQNLNPAILLAYCPQYQERLAAIMEKNLNMLDANTKPDLNDAQTENNDKNDDKKKRTVRK